MKTFERLNRFLHTKPYYKYLAAALPILFALLSIKFSKSFDKGTDWNVFYQAGVNFTDKVSLYSGIGGALRYIYPPFAAMLFQVFHVFSMKVAGGVWIFINWFIWLGTLYLIVRLLEEFNVEDKAIKFSLTLGTIFSFRYMWYHAMFAQMNLLVLFLSLLAIFYFLKGKQWQAAICLGIAISIKILPIIVLGWLITKSNYKLGLKALAVLIICTVLPFIFRGYEMSINDLKEYYTTFIAPFKEGRVEPNFQNYSLSAAIYKLVMPTLTDDNPQHYIYNLWSVSAVTAQTIYKVCLLIFLLLFAAVVFYTRFISKRINLYEISFVLLFTHLISGITWEYHLVSLLVAETLFFLQFKRSDSIAVKALHYIIIAFMFLNAIIGLDTVGMYLYYMSCGYSFLTLLMLVLMIHSIKQIFSKQAPSIALYHIPGNIAV